MTTHSDKPGRASDVAHRINAHLPADYRNTLLAEEERIERDILSPRGLAERLVLVLGGAGYIGSVLTGHLLARGYRVRCLDRLIYNNQSTVLPFLSHPGYGFVNGDLTDEAAVAAALDGVTDVVLLAGLVGDPITKKYPDESARINDRGYDAVLDMLNGRGLNKVLFVSTCSNYGLVEGDKLADEETALNPLSLYAEAKVKVEGRILDPRRNADYAPTVLRFATAFGLSPRMRFDLTVSEFTRDLFLGEELLVYDADTWRPYCHVEDFAEVIRRVLEAPVEAVQYDVFNAGGEVNNYTKRMIVEAVTAQVPRARVRYQEHGSDPRNYRVKFEKIRDRLHFTPKHTVPDGIAELVSALRQGLFLEIGAPTGFFGNYEINFAATTPEAMR